MSFRPKSVEYSEVTDFSVPASISVFAVTYTGTPHFFVDGSDMGPVSDLGGPQGLYELIGEFVADTGAIDLVKRTAGGIVCTRAVSPGVDTLAIAPRPPVPFARAVALRELIEAMAPQLGISLS